VIIFRRQWDLRVDLCPGIQIQRSQCLSTDNVEARDGAIEKCQDRESANLVLACRRNTRFAHIVHETHRKTDENLPTRFVICNALSRAFAGSSDRRGAACDGQRSRSETAESRSRGVTPVAFRGRDTTEPMNGLANRAAGERSTDWIHGSDVTAATPSTTTRREK